MLPANLQPAYEKFFALLSWSHFATHLEIKMNAHDYDMSTVYLTFFRLQYPACIYAVLWTIIMFCLANCLQYVFNRKRALQCVNWHLKLRFVKCSDVFLPRALKTKYTTFCLAWKLRRETFGRNFISREGLYEDILHKKKNCVIFRFVWQQQYISV